MSTPVTDPGVTSVEAWLANQKAAAQHDADTLNTTATANYLRAFDNWVLMVNAAIIPNTNPPKPPKKMGIGIELSFGPGLDYYQAVPTDDPVCDVPPVPVDRFTPKPVVANSIHILRACPGRNGKPSTVYFAAGEDDTWEFDKETPPMPLAQFNPVMGGLYILNCIPGPGNMGKMYEVVEKVG